METVNIARMGKGLPSTTRSGAHTMRSLSKSMQDFYSQQLIVSNIFRSKTATLFPCLRIWPFSQPRSIRSRILAAHLVVVDLFIDVIFCFYPFDCWLWSAVCWICHCCHCHIEAVTIVRVVWCIILYCIIEVRTLALNPDWTSMMETRLMSH